MIRKILYGIGAVALVGLIAIGVGAVLVVRNNAVIDAEAKPHVAEFVAEVSNKRNHDQVFNLFAPEIREKTKPQDIDALLDAMDVGLGHVVEIRAPQLQNWTAFSPVGGTSKTIANYSVAVRFEKGSAQIQVSAVKVDGQWMLWGFHVNSIDMMRNLAGRKT